MTSASLFRILLWRFRFELINLKRLVRGPNGRKLKYFAFGANTSPRVLKRRCIAPLASRPYELRDFALSFSHPTPRKGEGFASVSSQSGSSVYGVLFTLDELDARRLDYYELVPVLHRYRRITVTQDGEALFLYVSSTPRADLLPSYEYRDTIVSGLRALGGAPAGYLQILSLHPAIARHNPEFGDKHAFVVENLRSPIRFLNLYYKVGWFLFDCFIRDISPSEWLLKRIGFRKTTDTEENRDPFFDSKPPARAPSTLL